MQESWPNINSNECVCNIIIYIYIYMDGNNLYIHIIPFKLDNRLTPRRILSKGTSESSRRLQAWPDCAASQSAHHVTGGWHQKPMASDLGKPVGKQRYGKTRFENPDAWWGFNRRSILFS